ncbi:MAG: diguanylate cyclase [Rhodoferax sp.]|nr:diguanylate cyclase [Rhodoferax sp.]
MFTQPPQPSVDAAQALRQCAEARLQAQAAHLTDQGDPQSPQAAQQLLRELQVHQIELELQNQELRETHAALTTSRDKYFDLYDLAPVGYLSLSQKGLISQANLTASNLLGAVRKSLIGQTLSHFIVPSDQDIFFHFRKRLIDTGESLTCELRMVRTDGPAFWAHLDALAVPDADGSTALRIVLSNITERKQADDKLALAASVFSHAHEGIVVTDADANITEVNAAFTRITGYRRAEVLGKNPRLLSSGRHDRAFYDALWKQLHQQGYWCGEMWNRHKDGQVYAELHAISAVRDAQGAVQGYVALFSDISAQKAHEQQLERMARLDALTGLPNRLLKADRLQQAVALSRRSGHGLALVYIDLDGFKRINDQQGHEAGDQMLVALARRMQQVLREGDTLARIGGDEFVAILIDIDDLSACAPLLQRLLAAAAQPVQLKGQWQQVTASLGVTFYPQAQEVQADQLLCQADHAMYQAKKAGKNRYQAFDARQPGGGPLFSERSPGQGV